jgi:hypothetical protein
MPIVGDHQGGLRLCSCELESPASHWAAVRLSNSTEDWIAPGATLQHGQ